MKGYDGILGVEKKDMETQQPFASPIRIYIAQLLQTSFQFGKKYEEKKSKDL